MEANKFFISLIIYVFVAIATFGFVLPKYDELGTLQESLTSKQAEYEGKFIYYSKVADLIQTIESKKDSLDKVNNALPTDFTYAPVVYFLQKKGTETGLLVKSITFLPPSVAASNLGDQNIENVVFTVKVSGNYQGLKAFISSLEKSARLFQVISISFNNQGALPVLAGAGLGTQESVYNFEVIVKTNSYQSPTL